MNFLEKLDLLMKDANLNKSTLSQSSGIPYTTIDGWYKRGYAGAKLPTIQKLADFFNTTLDYLIRDEITDRFYGLNADFEVSQSERELIQKYRILDRHGRKAVDAILEVEYDRADTYYKKQAAAKTKKRTSNWQSPEPRRYPPNVVPIENVNQEDGEEDMITLPVYNAGASAGTGVFLDSTDYEMVAMPDDWLNRRANFGVWVDGDSMEPRFSNGDLVLVRTQPSVDIGDIGIFVLNGEGYIKKLGKNKLVSLNPAYNDIEIGEDDSIYVKGKVLGKA